MKSELIRMKSVTQANRAQLFLAQRRIKASVERITSPQGGCGFGIRVNGDTAKICAMLAEINIKCGKDGNTRR